MPDPDMPAVGREDVADYPELPGNVKIVGKLAESWTVGEDGTWAEFKLRQSVISNWGNEPTPADVVRPWERKFALGAIGSFFAKLLRMSGPDIVITVDPCTVRFHLSQANALLMKLQVNLYNNIFHSTKCKEVAAAKDPWARDFMTNDSAGFWIRLNTAFEPFDKVEVRQAMNEVFPKKDVLATICRGRASPMTGAMPSIYPGFGPSAEICKAGLAKAKAL